MKAAASPVLALLWLYRTLVSAPLHALYGSSMSCRFYPTCSHYAVEAVTVHGSCTGLFLAVKRLLKCTPFHPGGVDLVPARRVRVRSSVRIPRCDRVTISKNSASAPLSTSSSSALSEPLPFHG